MFRVRALATASLLAASSLIGLGLPMSAAAAGADPAPVAYLDGKPIPLAEVSKYFCDDFAFPVIRCSTNRLVIDLRATAAMLLAAVDYVTIYEHTGYAGSFMYVSQDYGALVTIGWNDRISSFKARNSETGRFWTEWFNGGSAWNFCCNQTTSSLGSYDNTFSSVQRL